MRIVLLFTLLAIVWSGQSKSQEQEATTKTLSGQWSGELSFSGNSLALVFHLKDDGSGAMDSPAQGAMGIPVSRFTLDGDSVSIEVPSLGGRYQGILNKADNGLEGHWFQSGGRLPLSLTRELGNSSPQRRDAASQRELAARQSTYDEEVIRFPSAENQEVTLAGTLSLPRGDGKPWPALVLISGSGAQDRNSSLSGHQPFKRLADEFTPRGYAVLRFDDRGVGESTGGFATATTYDFARDASGAVRFLQERDDIDDRRIVLVGHSEGGQVAQLAENHSDAVAGVIQIASPVLPYPEFVVDQVRDLSRESGESAAVTASKVEAQKSIIAAALAAGRDPVAIASAVASELEKLGVPEASARQQAAAFGSPWLSTYLNLDPAQALARGTTPVLIIWGSQDLQVNAESNAKALASLSLRKEVQALTLDGHNHLMQIADSGLVSAYATSGTTMSDEFIAHVQRWLERTL